MLKDSVIDRALRSNTLLYSAAILLRIVIFSIPSVAGALAHRVELVTPVTSYKRLTEGVYLYESNVPPYDGGLFHQAPLLLCIFSFLTSIPIPYIVPLVYALVDVAIAHALQRIAVVQQREENHQPKLAVEQVATAKRIHPFTVAALYLFNPLTVVSCISKSTIIFTNLSIVMAILWSRLGRGSIAMLWAALASYFSFYPAMLVPALLMMIRSSSDNSNDIRKQMLYGGFVFGTSLVGLLGGSRLLVGSWDFIPATYGTILFISDLTANTGMFWYFFIEIFDQFRSFFMVVFQLHAFIFVAPLCIRLANHPLVVITALAGIMAVFKSYPAAGDAALFLGLVPLHDQLLKCKLPLWFLVTNVLLYSSVLAPIFWHLWLYAGSGNANFFYAITLVYNLGLILLLIDLVYAVTRRDFDVANPDTIVAKSFVHK